MEFYRNPFKVVAIIFLITVTVLFSFLYQGFDVSAGEFRLTQSAQQKQQDTVQQHVQQNTQQQVLVVQENKISTKTYFYGSSLLASKSDNVITYYHNDYLGSVRLQSDAGAKKSFSSRTAPFGSDVLSSGAATGAENSYKFTGQESDENLYYYGARYYDARSGRFTQIDPVLSADSPYAYVSNNPLKFTDPNGEQGTEVLPDDFVGPPAENQVYASQLSQSQISMMGNEMYNSLRAGTMGSTTLHDIGGALAMENPTGHWLAFKAGIWNRISEHEFGLLTGQETYFSSLSHHKWDIIISTILSTFYIITAPPQHGRINPETAVSDIESINTILKGQRPVALVSGRGVMDVTYKNPKVSTAFSSGELKVRFYNTYQNGIAHEGAVVYRRGEDALANELYQIYSGRVFNEETFKLFPHRRIGEILHYDPDAIDAFMKNVETSP